MSRSRVTVGLLICALVAVAVIQTSESANAGEGRGAESGVAENGVAKVAARAGESRVNQVDCSEVAFCDDFEDQTGTTPAGAWQVSYPDCQGTGTVTVDRTVVNSGTTSIRVDGQAGYCNHAFVHNPTAVPEGPVTYGRMYLRHTTPLPVGHVTFATLTDAADDNRHLRLGGQNEALQWNRESDDATLPEQSPAGVALSMPLPVEQWNCLEFMIDGEQGLMSTWLNGVEVAGLHLDQEPTHDIDSQWLRRPDWRPQPVDLALGWESYSDGSDTLWFDDVALNPTRIGC